MSSTQKAMLLVLTSLLLLVSSVNQANADRLYGTTGGRTLIGQLYEIDPTTGLVTLIGFLVDASGAPFEVTGLSFSPLTGVLYTSRNSPTAPSNLVTINPDTGQVSIIGFSRNL
jgi:hypothetical protein